ncbi:hypothetical protein KSC_017080 [Ktedonobacter sp. SOSP1-52]|nr:hypothetical protein KSC_017080 [Ktedonobacter sp. SOSP1-52]
MSTQIILDHPDIFGFGIRLIHESLHTVGIILLCALLSHMDMSPASLGFDKDKGIAGSMALLFIVYTCGNS